MTAKTFVKWLDHIDRYMSLPLTSLIFDGVLSHLDISVAEKAKLLWIKLSCLPSNSIHLGLTV